MQKTTTFLMFVGDQFGKAEEAVRFYTSLFKNSEIKHIEYFKAGEPGGQEGTVKHAQFILAGQEYMASENPMSHQFTFTPAISIYVTCETEEEIETLFQKLSEGGNIMMPLGDYGFSKKFGWLSDKYGISWQLNLNALNFGAS
ncbi:VOC family protein [Pontibacter vulgaris]|uniref:VOC family protein n=1 Tax=Pontibacter vulgaris TaxID=2905679 RepID=UPI001FA7B7DD|nr:VOC family protein [Pontibacter vulgaris]